MNFRRLCKSLCFGRSGYRTYFQKQARFTRSFESLPSGKCAVETFGEKPLFINALLRDGGSRVIQHNSSTSRLSEKTSVLHQQTLCQLECASYYGTRCPPPPCPPPQPPPCPPCPPRPPPTDNCTEVSLPDVFSSWNKDRVQSILKSTKITTCNADAVGLLVPLCIVNGAPSILFIIPDRGEISFPGGDMDRCDRDVTDAALRVTHEDLGIYRECCQIWGVMSPITSKDGCKSVYPVLATCGEIETCKLRINCAEVKEVFTIRIEDLCDSCKIQPSQLRTQSGYYIPIYVGGVHKVTGLTGIILHEALALIAPGLYTYKLKYGC